MINAFHTIGIQAPLSASSAQCASPHRPSSGERVQPYLRQNSFLNLFFSARLSSWKYLATSLRFIASRYQSYTGLRKDSLVSKTTLYIGECSTRIRIYLLIRTCSFRSVLCSGRISSKSVPASSYSDSEQRQQHQTAAR